MTMLDVLKIDLNNMEEAASRTANRCDIWQDRIIYNISVALFHVLGYIIRKESKPVPESTKTFPDASALAKMISQMLE